MKNLLKEVMIKDLSKKKNVVRDEDTSFVDGLIEKIESGYLAQTKPKFTKKSNFSASGLTYGAGECPRYWYMMFDGAPAFDNSTAFGVANRNNGTLGHQRIQQAIELSGILDKEMVMDEVPRKYNKQEHPAMEFRVKMDDPPFDGYGDVMLNINDERVIGEIKTIGNEGFEYKKRSQKPKMGHLMQLLIYMRVWKIDKGVMIYENKNNHELLTLPVVMNDHFRRWVDQAFDWMRVVYASWKKQELPQNPYRSNSKICKECPIQKACAEAETGVIKLKPLELLEDEKL
ncbi:MAG: Dna2/Cas4 domain-containing protein [Alphaproteobacteria bacterium]|nr:Dna2/Cas4 domain-containing protein [Alphaproteobacteria bacterium]